jgi:hypothetical protein
MTQAFTNICLLGLRESLPRTGKGLPATRIGLRLTQGEPGGLPLVISHSLAPKGMIFHPTSEQMAKYTAHYSIASILYFRMLCVILYLAFEFRF